MPKVTSENDHTDDQNRTRASEERISDDVTEPDDVTDFSDTDSATSSISALSVHSKTSGAVTLARSCLFVFIPLYTCMTF